MSLSRSLLRNARPRPIASPSSSSPLALRSFASSRPSLAAAEPAQAAQAQAEPAAAVSPKIAPIVETISTLSLLEVSELVSALKTKLNITEIALPAASPASSAASAGGAAEAPVEEKPKEKTIFTVKLEKFDAAAKAKIIREVKAMMPNMNLVEGLGGEGGRGGCWDGWSMDETACGGRWAVERRG
ncbi:hypothetical protein I350_03217 [Cryptococcus amylolentus CBS 6273]|uniref:Large ribosomal subunit protein bL12 oligomerization domain-containing protein n=1 Tax=Cryptococcus amylolentus CBS 6273 TaxID=1296118 RepID=A0A1E3K943_9TREE|nr:hypothetical protein I350_03217 [Cryptococcus amylolentus CBS 6273]